MTSVERRLAGKDNNFFDGITSAFSRIPKIFYWSLIESIVATILQFIQNHSKNNGIGKLVKSIIGGIWSVMTYFTFPLMILSSKGLKDAIRESSGLFKKTWGEQTIIFVSVTFVIGTITFAIDGIGMFLMMLSAHIQSAGLALFSIIFVAIITFLAIIFTDVCQAIIKVLLLYYAITGKMPEKLDTADIAMLAPEK